MLIRKLAPPDRDAIVALLRSDTTFHAEEIDVALELVDEALEDPEEGYDVLVCDEAGKVLGYVCYGKTPMTEWTWDLYWIATHKDARGKGIATKLVGAMEETIARERGRIVRLETSQMEAYGAARTFYERRGYVEVGRIADFYKAGDDLIIFAKRLDGDSSSRNPRT